MKSYKIVFVLSENYIILLHNKFIFTFYKTQYMQIN